MVKMQFISYFFFSEYKRLQGVFLLLCNFTFQETSFTFNSKNGLKNKLIIVFIKQSHPTKNRTNIFAIMWEPSKSTKSLTFHFRKYDVQSSLFQRSVKILYETFDRNISSNKQLITFYISEFLAVGLYQYNSTIKGWNLAAFAFLSPFTIYIIAQANVDSQSKAINESLAGVKE